MSEQSNGGPAFPTSHSPDYPNEIVGGMALRDYFAAKSLQGALASTAPGFNGMDNVALAKYAYVLADAMLAARTQESKQ